jgi:hypothetical protein
MYSYKSTLVDDTFIGHRDFGDPLIESCGYGDADGNTSNRIAPAPAIAILAPSGSRYEAPATQNDTSDKTRPRAASL